MDDTSFELRSARLLLLALTATIVPGCSASAALWIGWRQHAVLPSPNSGWSEAATAGAIRRRLIGPIWRDDRIVTEIWLGAPADPVAETAADFGRAAALLLACGLLAAGLAVVALALFG